MKFVKKFDNGLRLVVDKIEGLFSVSAGVLVKTGSVNETDNENGISHFIEHMLFKGTEKRSAFEISDYIDRIGAQINAFTSKEMTCYYTKSTSEHFEDSLEVLSDIFFNSVFDEKEMEREKGVVIEEINMCEDTPEEVCLDLISTAYYGNEGFGRTILGSIENINSFTVNDIKKYMNEYYTAENVVISLAGNVDFDTAVVVVEKLFAEKFDKFESRSQFMTKNVEYKHLYRTKQIEQSHIALAMTGVDANSNFLDALNIANVVFGGGMSSRLFQKVREELGLAYSVYSYLSSYKDQGIIEIYAGVNNDKRDHAVSAILSEIDRFNKSGVTMQEFLRGKEQIKSAFIMGRESTSSQMLLHGRYMTLLDKELDFNERLKRLDNITLEEVNSVIKEFYTGEKIASATVGSIESPLKI